MVDCWITHMKLILDTWRPFKCPNVSTFFLIPLERIILVNRLKLLILGVSNYSDPRDSRLWSAFSARSRWVGLRTSEVSNCHTLNHKLVEERWIPGKFFSSSVWRTSGTWVDCWQEVIHVQVIADWVDLQTKDTPVVTSSYFYLVIYLGELCF